MLFTHTYSEVQCVSSGEYVWEVGPNDFRLGKRTGVGGRDQSNILSKHWKTCDRTSAFVKSSSKSTRCCPANGKFNCKAVRGDSKLLMFVLPARTTSHCIVGGSRRVSLRCAHRPGVGCVSSAVSLSSKCPRKNCHLLSSCDHDCRSYGLTCCQAV